MAKPSGHEQSSSAVCGRNVKKHASWMYGTTKHIPAGIATKQDENRANKHIRFEYDDDYQASKRTKYASSTNDLGLDVQVILSYHKKKTRWQPEMEARLEVGVRTFRSGNWSFVAAYVGDDVTAKQCSKRWRKITKKRAGQSEEEHDEPHRYKGPTLDARVEDSAECGEPDIDADSGSDDAADAFKSPVLKTMTASIEQQWELHADADAYSSSYSSCKGEKLRTVKQEPDTRRTEEGSGPELAHGKIAWSAEMDKRLVRGVQKFKADGWPFVAAYVGAGVTAKQCSQRWKGHLKQPTEAGIISRAGWSTKEDTGHHRYGSGSSNGHTLVTPVDRTKDQLEPGSDADINGDDISETETEAGVDVEFEGHPDSPTATVKFAGSGSAPLPAATAANNAGGGFTPASKQLMAVNQEPDTDEGTGEGTHSVARENIVHNHGDGGRVFWTPAMDARLHKCVKEYRENGWAFVALHVGYGVTEMHCRHRWNGYLSKLEAGCKGAGGWSEQEIKLLKELVPQHVVKPRWSKQLKTMTRQHTDWIAIGAKLHRIIHDCKSKWEKLQDAALSTGPFNAEEDALIRYRVEGWGPSKRGLWLSLQQDLGRPSRRIQQRWVKTLSKRRSL